jgi:hypothetical protein
MPTGKLIIPDPISLPDTNRAVMMPRRTRSRAYRIALERQRNAGRIACKHFLPAERIARDDQPPPF